MADSNKYGESKTRKTIVTKILPAREATCRMLGGWGDGVGGVNWVCIITLTGARGGMGRQSNSRQRNDGRSARPFGNAEFEI